ncbi:MAG: CHRD domain-containing protein [Armatimonadetes bacterium]|nr:CHRD domain-containing protein [Armatimonadota bacterium]
MQKWRLCSLVVAVLCALGAAAHADMNFRAMLTGSQEVPPNDSEAMGHGFFVLKSDLIFTANLRGGEICGQIEPVPEPGSLVALLTMCGLSALGYLKRRVS